MKKCNKCAATKDLSLFSKDKHKEDGLCTICKECARANKAKWYKENKQKAIDYSQKWIAENKELHERTRKARYFIVRDERLAKRRLRHKEEYKENELYSLNHKVRAMIRRVLKATNKSKDFVTFKKIGYTSVELKSRLEFQFKSGMSWDNFGEWEIDHKVPVSIMIAKGETRVEVINALSNLQPLWRKDNRSKGARYIG